MNINLFDILGTTNGLPINRSQSDYEESLKAFSILKGSSRAGKGEEGEASNLPLMGPSQL